MEDFVTTFHYRGFSFPIYIDEEGKFFTYVAGKLVKVADQNYESRIRNIVDRQMDLISEINQNAWIEWFDNDGHSDIRLKINGRIVKVWLVHDPYKVDLDKVTAEATDIVNELSKLLLK
jgi:hypothetical protein